MAVKVSVVIPVYNPGEYIEDCIASILRQSLPDDAYEAVFVDDGSTDGTAERLDRLAAEYSQISVIHQEPSGWSGKPRNVGVAASRGEFVMFVDNDDWLGDEALERMYDYGVAHDADVVVGKMAAKGRPVPRELFRKNSPRATLDNAPLMDSLTPHKMFRREFLDRHQLRFMEGRRRLEDHVFVAEAYLLASNISVLSDYICYYHVSRDDASNAGFQRFDAVGYFKNLREALDVVERHTEPGPRRDRLFRRWLRVEMVERMRGNRLLSLPQDYRQELLNEMHAVVGERFGPGVAAPLEPTQQLVAALISAGRLTDIEEFARWEVGVRPVARLDRLAWEGEALKIGFAAEYRTNGGPILFRTEEGHEGRENRVVVAPPLSADAREAVAAAGADLCAPLDRAKTDLVIRERDTGAEFFQPVEFSCERVEEEGEVRDGGFRVVLKAVAAVDPATAANGCPLGPGIWDVFVRITLCGWSKDARLGADRGESVDAQRIGTLTGSPARLVLPYWTEPHGNLSLDIDHETSRFDREVKAALTPERLVVDAGRITIPLPLCAPQATEAVLEFEELGGKETVELPVRVEPAQAGRAVLEGKFPAERLAGRRWRLRLGLPSPKRGRPRLTALPVILEVTGDGSAVARKPPARAGVAAAPGGAGTGLATLTRARKWPPVRLARRVVGRIRRALTN
jgi:poly(ribitol-phosphate) beta-N-acetylglucosaminyltransferase